MPAFQRKPRILIVTPEVTYLPKGMGNIANYLTAKAGGLADVSASLIGKLFEMGADVHVALPDYRTLFNDQFTSLINKEIRAIRSHMPTDRIHLAQDRAFYYQSKVYSSDIQENIKIALAFQREVINNTIPFVMPDLIHCNDWMTGLIPAVAKQYGIPSLFTLHNIHTVKTSLMDIEDRGIDAGSFWSKLYYERMPLNYEESRVDNMVDYLVSGVFSADCVNTVSPTFLKEILEGRHYFVSDSLKNELIRKCELNAASGILNAPDCSYNPHTDADIIKKYSPNGFLDIKLENKRYLQNILSLKQDDHAPMFFWPSRLDDVQKGCELLYRILVDTVQQYENQNIQIVFVAEGGYQPLFRDLVYQHQLQRSVAVCSFDEKLARIAYAGSDFVFMPSKFEPCGLPQMIGPLYGALPVAHDTGGIHDTVKHINIDKETGNGFLFEHYDEQGLRWAIEEAIKFHTLPLFTRSQFIKRIMEEAEASFNHSNTATQYINLYEKMLDCSLVYEKTA